MNHKHRAASLVLALALLDVMGAATAWAKQGPQIPAGTTISVRVIDKLSSEDNQAGDIFHGTLEEPIRVDGRDLYPKGADVSGRVSDAQVSGRLSQPGELDLVLTSVTTGDISSSLAVEPLVIKGESHAKSNATKIGGGAALGAVIGAIAGGGKGAAVGAGVGGAAGTGAAAATGKKPATVDPEAVLTFATISAPGGSIRSGEEESVPPSGDASANAISEPQDRNALFSLRDRRVIRDCAREHASEFPAGMMEQQELPPPRSGRCSEAKPCPPVLPSRSSPCR